MKIVLTIAIALIFTACSDEKISESKVKEEVVKKEVRARPIKPKTKVLNDIATAKAKATIKTGAQVFVKCSGCHGQNAEKSALGKSQIIKGWDASKISHALNGYKDGTYGGAMKGLMKGQVSGLNAEDISLVAKHISGL